MAIHNFLPSPYAGANKLKTAVAPLSEVLRSAFRFIIPPFQRKYSWNKKNWTSLWDDLLNLYSRSESTSESISHFMGALVYGEARTGGPTQQTIPEYEIIDGQQRLLTLSIFIAALRDTLGSTPERKDFLNYTYLWHQAIGTRPDQLRITPAQRDLATYEQILLGNTPAPSTDLIYKAYEFFTVAIKRGIQEPTDAQSDEDIEEAEIAASQAPVVLPFDFDRLLQIATKSLVVVAISEVPTASAYQVFSTINATGLPLAQVDLLRNAIFMLLPSRGPATYTAEWEPMEALLGEDLETFFLTDLIRTGGNVTRGNIYAQFMENARKYYYTEEKLAHELTQIRQRAAVYNTLRRGVMPISILGKQLPQAALDSIARLREWGDVPALPLTLDAVLRWNDGEISSSQLDDIFVSIESLLVRRFVVGVPPNDLRSAFSRAMQSIGSGGGFHEKTIAHLNEDRFRWPSDAAFKKALLEQPIYTRGAKYAGLVLKAIAMREQGRECPEISIGTSSSSYSVEHILPQTLNNEWIADLQKWGERNPYELQSEKSDVIGNLTLTAYNSSLSNRRFSEKKSLIQERLFLKISRDILDNEMWTGSVIDARSEHLADVATKIWPHN